MNPRQERRLCEVGSRRRDEQPLDRPLNGERLVEARERVIAPLEQGSELVELALACLQAQRIGGAVDRRRPAIALAALQRVPVAHADCALGAADRPEIVIGRAAGDGGWLVA